MSNTLWLDPRLIHVFIKEPNIFINYFIKKRNYFIREDHFCLFFFFFKSPILILIVWCNAFSWTHYGTYAERDMNKMFIYFKDLLIELMNQCFLFFSRWKTITKQFLIQMSCQNWLNWNDKPFYRFLPT